MPCCSDFSYAISAAASGDSRKSGALRIVRTLCLLGCVALLQQTAFGSCGDYLYSRGKPVSTSSEHVQRSMRLTDISLGFSSLDHPEFVYHGLAHGAASRPFSHRMFQLHFSLPQDYLPSHSSVPCHGPGCSGSPVPLMPPATPGLQPVSESAVLGDQPRHQARGQQTFGRPESTGTPRQLPPEIDYPPESAAC